MSDMLSMNHLVLQEMAEENAKYTGQETVVEAYSCPQDERIARAALIKRVRIRIAGCGGAGSNTIDRLMQSRVDGADLLAINTDAQHLNMIKSKAKLLIGRRRTKGEGAGGFPKIGEEAALEEVNKIRELLRGSDIAFITCGLGGGTGTGSAPIVARAAKETGATVFTIVTLPFKSEGTERMNNAIGGLEKLIRYSDTILAIPNDKIVAESPSRNVNEAFNFADSVLAETIKGLTELITKTGVVNIDYADVSNILKIGRTAVVGIGESDDDKDKVLSAVKNAINFPLIDADISTARGCLVSVIGGDEITVKEFERALAEIQSRIHPDATVKWGCRVEPGMNGKIKVMTLLVGVKSPFSVNTPEDIRNIERIVGDMRGTSDIDFIR